MSDTVKAHNAIADLVHGYAELVRLKQGALCGAVARSSCVMMSQTIPAGHGTFGKYEDSYRCDSGAWLFQSRIYTIFLANSEAGR